MTQKAASALLKQFSFQSRPSMKTRGLAKTKRFWDIFENAENTSAGKECLGTVCVRPKSPKNQRYCEIARCKWPLTTLPRINLNIFAFLSPILPKQHNENIKNHKVPEKVGPENRKPKFYNSLGLDQCDRNPKTNSEFFFFSPNLIGNSISDAAKSSYRTIQLAVLKNKLGTSVEILFFSSRRRFIITWQPVWPKIY